MSEETIWRPIEIIPRNGGSYIAIGDEEMATVTYEPEAGMLWKIRSAHGGALRLGRCISITFHSWTTCGELHRLINSNLNPEYYGNPPQDDE